jgi:hypothetical protein
MKAVFKLSLVAILLLCTTLANGQLADSTLYKVKLEKFKKKEHNGKVLTVIGPVTFFVGAAFCFVALDAAVKADEAGAAGEWDKKDKYDSKFLLYGSIGDILGLTGLGISIAGPIKWTNGHKRAKEYQLKLDDARSGFYFNPNSIGVTLTFKF